MKPFEAEDLVLHRRIGKLVGHPHHDWLVFPLKRPLRKSDSYERTLWALRIDAEQPRRPRQMTSTAFSSSFPAMDPRGATMAFLSRRGKSGRQVHLLPFDGGEAIELTHPGDESPTSLEGWSGNGRSLLAVASIQWKEDGGREDQWQVGRPPQVARFLPYKQDGSGITVGKRSHLYRIDAASGKLQALTSGDFDVVSGAWSPDGQTLAYLRKRDGRQRHRTDLWLAGADGSAPRLLVGGLASISVQAWSPDGRWLALAASEVEGDSMMQLWLADARSGQLRRLCGKDFELASPAAIEWHPDGARIAVIADVRGLQNIALIDVSSGRTHLVKHGLRCVQGLTQCRDRLVFIASGMRKMEEIYSVDWEGNAELRHSDFNRERFAHRLRPRVAKRRFVVPDGNGASEKVDAWLLRPAEGEGPFPLLVDMHGGPHSTVLVDFPAHVYWYVLLSQGWAVLAPNAVGSGSYGRRFATRLRGRWGELDLPQYEAIVRTLQAEGIADDRVACAGKSYGGFLAAWAVCHSDLFKAAAVAAPVADIESHAGTSDTGYYVTPFAMGGELPDVRDRCHRLSPVTHCAGVTAATLILQGENDGRCPRGQSEELFARLIRYCDAPVELVVYPSSTHSEAESGKPSNRIDYHRRLACWLQRHASTATT